ncbi:MAG TPA: hypothetical protein VD905_02935 [Flavobacteriales bacterium]|nr:hypothetical protein [Flavobacteriales bacterium]
MKNINSCCDTFLWKVSEIGKKGLSIIPIKESDILYFALQGRSHDVSEVADKHSMFQQAIRFCPWCGKDLQNLITENKIELAKLAELNKKYAL